MGAFTVPPDGADLVGTFFKYSNKTEVVTFLIVHSYYVDSYVFSYFLWSIFSRQ